MGVCGVAEIEPFPCHVLHERFGASCPRYMPENDFKAVKNLPTQTGLINFGDVSQVVEQDIKNLGRIDLVVFGSPCQNLSVAGNRKGLQGESSGLFYEAIRLIQYARKHCGLRFAIWENVPGAFSSNKGNDFREVVRELSANRDINTPKNGWGNTGVALGENGLVEWRVLDAQYFGLAQRRKRVFAVVDFGNWRDRPPILLEPKSVCGDTPPSRETRKGIADNTNQRLASGGNQLGVDEEVCYTLTTADRHGICYLESNQNNATVFDDNQPCATLAASMGMGGGYVPMVAKELPPTSIIRRLTPTECERLQGFPDNYTQIPYRKKPADQCPDGQRYKALGNSMAVPVMTWIGKQIQEAFIKSGGM